MNFSIPPSAYALRARAGGRQGHVKIRRIPA